MAEAIIGREHGTNRLIMRINNQAYALSTPGSAPKTVSSTHCRLLISEKRELTLSNIKSQLNTYVDGIQINSKHITLQSRVELGEDHFPVDMAMVEKVIDKVLPPPPETFSLLPLEPIWKEYDETRLKYQLEEQRRANWRAGGGVLSLIGFALALIPIPKTWEMANIGDYRVVFVVAAALVAIYFFIRGFDSSKSLVVRLRKLDEKFRKDYVCPNPKCKHFMGNIPYDVLRRNTKCPYCGCHYTS